MQRTAWVEGRLALRALVGIEVGTNSHFMGAGSTAYGKLVKLVPRPLLGRMFTQSFMAPDAGVVCSAAFHFNSHNVGRSVVVNAARLRIELYAAHRGMRDEV